MKHVLTLALAVASALTYSQAQDHSDGQIRGNVIDRSGNPVPGATVYVVPQDITFDGITRRSVKTNGKGMFDFRGSFPLGAYQLYSRKAADGYPDRSDSFYADSSVESPKVNLTEDHSFATVTVTMGEKAGVLVGRVVDAKTRVPVKAKLVFWDENGNDHSVFVNGKFRTLLPPEKDLTMMVIMPGYGTQSPVAPLRLEPGQERRMDILASKQQDSPPPRNRRLK